MSWLNGWLDRLENRMSYTVLGNGQRIPSAAKFNISNIDVDEETVKTVMSTYTHTVHCERYGVTSTMDIRITTPTPQENRTYDLIVTFPNKTNLDPYKSQRETYGALETALDTIAHNIRYEMDPEYMTRYLIRTQFKELQQEIKNLKAMLMASSHQIPSSSSLPPAADREA